MGVHGPPGVPTEKKPITCELCQLTGVEGRPLHPVRSTPHHPGSPLNIRHSDLSVTEVYHCLVGFVSLRPEGVADGGSQGVLLASSEAEKTANPTHHPVVGSDSIWWFESVVERTLSRRAESRLVLST